MSKNMPSHSIQGLTMLVYETHKDYKWLTELTRDDGLKIMLYDQRLQIVISWITTGADLVVQTHDHTVLAEGGGQRQRVMLALAYKTYHVSL